MAKESELKIWSLQVPTFQQIQACNCVLAFFDYHQSV
jgi:hypothetical protein